MARQDDFIKTALRLPRELHSAIRSAAEGGGKSMNAEIIGRLQESLRAEQVGSLLSHLKTREAELLEANRHQLQLLWGLIARVDLALAQGAEAIDVAPDNAKLLHEIAVLRELIRAIQVHKL